MSLENMAFSTVLLVAAACGVVLLFENRFVEPEPAVAAPAAVEVAAPATPASATTVSIPRSNGQFFTQARVNSGSVRFLIDTGASVVALTPMDARKAGFNPSQLSYDQPIQTANGITYAARVSVSDMSVGGIRIRNVDAVVVKQGLDISLLGMTFLGELQKVEATPHQMILKL